MDRFRIDSHTQGTVEAVVDGNYEVIARRPEKVAEPDRDFVVGVPQWYDHDYGLCRSPERPAQSDHNGCKQKPVIAFGEVLYGG